MAEPSLPRGLHVLRAVIAPATVIGALMYYFGWVRTRAPWAYYGADPSMLGFGTQDYVLRSIDAMLGPLAMAAVVALGMRAADRALTTHLSRTGPTSRLYRSSRRLLAGGWVGVLWGAPHGPHPQHPGAASPG